MTKKKSDARPVLARWSPARPVVIALWVLILLLSVYQAEAIRDEVEKNEFLRDQKWLQQAITSVMQAGDAIGIGTMQKALGELRTKVNAPYTVLVADDTVETDGDDKTDGEPAEPEQMRHRTARRPRRVLVIGASSIQFAIGIELEKGLPRDYANLKIRRFGQLATGLTRPDFMNWPEKLRSLAKTFKPDLVICNFGGNDAQPVPVGKYGRVEYGTPEWDKKYGERVTEMIEIAREHGADTVMIGMPVMRSPKFSKKMRRLNRVMKAVTEAAGMLFVSTYEKASTADGAYRTEIQFRGKRGLMRTSDGVHYTRLGARFVIEQVMQEVERRYRFEPSDTDLAPAQRHGFDSPTQQKTVWYTAYVPSNLKVRRPAVVLLPNGDDWSEWPRHPHRRLQDWAQRRQVILIVPEDADRTAYVGPAAKVLRDELPVDLRRHLPVSEVSFAGSGRGGLSALAVGARSAGLLLYRPWFDLTKHADDPALLAALGEPKGKGWNIKRLARPEGPMIWFQAGKDADPLRERLGGRLLDAGRPAKTFIAALDAGLPVLVPPPEVDSPPEDTVPR